MFFGKEMHICRVSLDCRDRRTTKTAETVQTAAIAGITETAGKAGQCVLGLQMGMIRSFTFADRTPGKPKVLAPIWMS